LHKGDKVFIEGKIRSRQWTDDSGQTRYSVEISADSMTMLGPNPMRQADRSDRPYGTNHSMEDGGHEEIG
jgi:single-strand DNA-binding protein